jgi:hypothetical protein
MYRKYLKTVPWYEYRCVQRLSSSAYSLLIDHLLCYFLSYPFLVLSRYFFDSLYQNSYLYPDISWTNIVSSIVFKLKSIEDLEMVRKPSLTRFKRSSYVGHSAG